MNEAKKSFDPWRLILILLCAIGFVGGIYLLNTTINTRFDAVDAAVSANAGTSAMAVKRIDEKLVNVMDSIKAMEAKMAAPPPPPPPVASDDAAAAAAPAPADAAAAPAPAPAKAP